MNVICVAYLHDVIKMAIAALSASLCGQGLFFEFFGVDFNYRTQPLSHLWMFPKVQESAWCHCWIAVFRFLSAFQIKAIQSRLVFWLDSQQSVYITEKKVSEKNPLLRKLP